MTMKFVNYAIILQFFIAFGLAVHLDVAFKKDWVTYNHNLFNIIKLPSNHVLGQTSDDTIYNFNERNKLTYAIDLSLHGHDSFELIGPYIASYSSSRSSVSFHRLSNGVFVDSIQFDSPSISMKYAASAVFILLANHELGVWDEKAFHSLGSYLDSYFNLFEINDQIIFASQNNLGKIFNGSALETFDADETVQDEVLKGSALPPFLPLNTDYFCIFSKGILLYKFDKQGPKLLSRLKLEGSLIWWSFTGDTLEVSTLKGSVKINTMILVGKEDIRSQNKDLSVSDKITLIYQASSKVRNELEAKDLNDYYGLPEFRTTNFEPLYLPISYVASGKATLVTKPASRSIIEKVNHLEHEIQSSILLYRYLLRCKDHLVQLGQFVTNIWLSSSEDELLSKDVDYFSGTLLIYFDLFSHSLVAKEASNGQVAWVSDFPDSEKVLEFTSDGSKLTVIREKSMVEVSLRDGSVLSTTAIPAAANNIVKYVNKDGVDSLLRIDVIPSDFNATEPMFAMKQTGNCVHGFRIKDSALLPTWEFYEENETIVAVSKNSEKNLRAAGIARSDKSVLYKFLNPNLVAIVTKYDGGLRLSLLDGVLGRLLHQSIVTKESVDAKSVKIVLSNNWIVVTYLIHAPSLEQRITVFDLFINVALTRKNEVSSFENITFDVSHKAFVFPERIVALAATETRFGITTKSILVFTTNGNLIEIPKYILNSRRIDDRKMDQADYMDDFRMSPYEPLIKKDAMKVLNHKIKLKSDGNDQILVKATDLESTAIVCLVNSLNEFCSIVQPSLSYDTLPEAFRKTSLMVTIATLLVVYIATKPLVYSKRLNEKWIE